MIGLLLAFLTAISESIKDTISKKSLENINEYVVSWSLRFFAFLFILPVFLFIEIPQLNREFYFAILSGGLIVAVTTVLYMKAIKHSDLSISVPMLSFTPLFLLITSPIITKEFPNKFGIIGVFLIVAGSYLLNIKDKSNGYLSPFKSLLKEKGAKLMLIVAFLWSISSNIDKIGVQNSSSLFWALSINLFSSIILLPVLFLKCPDCKEKIKINFKILALIGFFIASGLVFQMNAIKFTLVAYVISIKRTSIIMSALLGYLVFKEKNLKNRLLGISIMILGVLFITLS